MWNHSMTTLVSPSTQRAWTCNFPIKISIPSWAAWKSFLQVEGITFKLVSTSFLKISLAQPWEVSWKKVPLKLSLTNFHSFFYSFQFFQSTPIWKVDGKRTSIKPREAPKCNNHSSTTEMAMISLICLKFECLTNRKWTHFKISIGNGGGDLSTQDEKEIERPSLAWICLKMMANNMGVVIIHIGCREKTLHSLQNSKI